MSTMEIRGNLPVPGELSANQTPVKKRASLSKNSTPLKSVHANSLMRPTISSQNKKSNKENGPNASHEENMSNDVSVIKTKALSSPPLNGSVVVQPKTSATKRLAPTLTSSGASSAESSATKSSNLSRSSPLENLRGLNQRMRAEIMRSEFELHAHVDALKAEIAAKEANIQDLEHISAHERQGLEEKIAVLQDEIQKMNAERAEGEKKFFESVQKMQLQSTTLQNMIADLENCKIELYETVAHLEQQRASLQDDLAREAERVGEAKERHAQLTAEICEIRREREALQTAHGVALDTMNENLQALNVQLHGIEEREAAAREDIAALEQKLADSTAALAEERTLCAKKDEIILSLQSAQGALKSELAAENNKLISLEQQLRSECKRGEELQLLMKKNDADWTAKHDLTLGANTQLKEEICLQREEMDVLASGVLEMREQLALTIADKIEMEGNLKAVSKENGELISKLEQANTSKTMLRNLNADLLKRVKEVAQECVLKEDQIQSLCEEVDGVLQRHASLKADNAALTESLNACREEQEQTRAEFDSLKKAHEHLQTEHASLRGDLDKSQDHLHQVRDQLKESEAEKSALRLQLQESNASKLELVAQLEEARTELNTLERQSAEERDTLMKSIEVGRKTMDTARERIEEMVQNTHELEAERESHLDAIDVLREETELRDAELSRLSEAYLSMKGDLQEVGEKFRHNESELRSANELIRKLEREKNNAQALLQQSQKILSMLQAGLSAQHHPGENAFNIESNNNVRKDFVDSSDRHESSAASVWMQRAVALALMDGECVRSAPTTAAEVRNSESSDYTTLLADESSSSFWTAHEQ